jgi:hypothetical protein
VFVLPLSPPAPVRICTHMLHCMQIEQSRVQPRGKGIQHNLMLVLRRNQQQHYPERAGILPSAER